MSDIWGSWVGDRSVRRFLAEVDAAVAEGVFPDRRAAFLEYANHALTQLASAPAGPPGQEDGLGAGNLADLLLAHALDSEGRARRGAAFSVN